MVCIPKSTRTRETADRRFAGRPKTADLDFEVYVPGFRYYNPSLGRWMSRDPLGENGGWGLYGFVLNDPLSCVDRLGLRSCRTDRFSFSLASLGSMVARVPLLGPMRFTGFFRYDRKRCDICCPDGSPGLETTHTYAWGLSASKSVGLAYIPGINAGLFLSLSLTGGHSANWKGTTCDPWREVDLGCGFLRLYGGPQLSGFNVPGAQFTLTGQVGGGCDLCLKLREQQQRLSLSLKCCANARANFELRLFAFRYNFLWSSPSFCTPQLEYDLIAP